MHKDYRRKLLVWVGLTGVLLFLVAGSLARLQFEPGLPLPRMEESTLVAPGAGRDPSITLEIDQFFFVVMGALMGLGLLVLLYRALKGVQWKRLWLDFVRLLGVILVLVALLFIAINMMPVVKVETVAIPMVTETPPATAPLGPPPPLLIWLVGLGLAVCVALAAAWVFGARRKPAEGINWLGLEAEKARQALLVGGETRDVILQCYQRMSQVLQEEQGIERQPYMTSGEFERVLVEDGYPQAPVRQLTRIFEIVRYGRGQPGTEEQQAAIAALEAIVAFSRAAGGEV